LPKNRVQDHKAEELLLKELGKNKKREERSILLLESIFIKNLKESKR